MLQFVFQELPISLKLDIRNFQNGYITSQFPCSCILVVLASLSDRYQITISILIRGTKTGKCQVVVDIVYLCLYNIFVALLESTFRRCHIIPITIYTQLHFMHIILQISFPIFLITIVKMLLHSIKRALRDKFLQSYIASCYKIGWQKSIIITSCCLGFFNLYKFG